MSNEKFESKPTASRHENVSINHVQTHETIQDGDSEMLKMNTKGIDDAVLRAQGHEAAMPRSFSWLGSVGLGFSITNSWLSFASCFGQSLMYGGPQCAVFGLLVACAVQWTITLGLAEQASAFPSSGGQYHFTYILAPEKHKRFAAFSVGTLSVFGWWIITSSGISNSSQSISGIVLFWFPDFVMQQWQVYLIYDAIILVTLIPLFVISQRRIGQWTQGCLYFSVLGVVVITIVILALSKGYQPASFITASNQGVSGWAPGTAWVMSIGNAIYAFSGLDAVIHITEEMHRPGKRIPQVLNMTMLIGLCTVIPFTIAMMFVIKDLDAVRNSPLPSMEVFYQATGNRALSTFLQCWLTTLYMSCMPSQWITSGRMVWAFARDRGLPYSNYWTHIHSTLDFPARATLLSAFFCMIYGLLYVVSKTAFNSIITSAVLVLNITYAVPQGIAAVQGRSKVLPRRPFDLGKWGYVSNIFTPLWVTVIGVFFCFPNMLPVSAGSMNYVSLVLVVLLVAICGLWWLKRKDFDGPQIDWASLNEANAME